MSATIPAPSNGAAPTQPLIAHIPSTTCPRRALCGQVLEGIDAPDHADRCVVCRDMCPRR